MKKKNDNRNIDMSDAQRALILEDNNDKEFSELFNIRDENFSESELSTDSAGSADLLKK